MDILKLSVLNKEGQALSESGWGENIWLVHKPSYVKGDFIRIECKRPGVYCSIRLDDSLPFATVYISKAQVDFPLPAGRDRKGYAPRCFRGEDHYISARLVEGGEAACRRNLAFNPYDFHESEGMYPHVRANFETRGLACFAARNTIDGIYANSWHGAYPYQSWGINRREDAELRLEFGTRVYCDMLRITLRADFPHDSYWTKGTVKFSDGSSEVLSFEKTEKPQDFIIEGRNIEWLTFGELIKAEDESPFPSLTQLEAWGQT